MLLILRQEDIVMACVEKKGNELASSSSGTNENVVR